MKEQIIAAYLDWVNNYLMRDKFAKDYGITIEQAEQLIALGYSLHEAQLAQSRSA